MNNPFVYGKEVSGYQFYDRTNEAEELYRHMKDGSTNIVLDILRPTTPMPGR